LVFVASPLSTQH